MASTYERPPKRPKIGADDHEQRAVSSTMKLLWGNDGVIKKTPIISGKKKKRCLLHALA